jgi:hypothetical protein
MVVDLLSLHRRPGVIGLHRQHGRYLARPACPVLTSLNLSIPDRVAALRELMKSGEQEAQAELDNW